MKKRRKTLKDVALAMYSRASDPETFAFALGVYSAAFMGHSPNSHVPPPPPDATGYSFADIPINRGMLAVMREMQHLSHDDRTTLCARIMEVSQTVSMASEDERFSEHLIWTPTHMNVSNSFINAMAVCKFKMSGDKCFADLDDIHERLSEMPDA